MTRISRGIAAALSFAAVFGCSSSTGSDGGGGGGGGGNNRVVTIHLTEGLRFSPASVSVRPGTRVRWVNDAAMNHSITPDNPGQAGVFAAKQLQTQGATFEYVFSEEGDFYYHCVPHQAQGMEGYVRVTRNGPDY
jgi:plastocyanin